MISIGALVLVWFLFCGSVDAYTTYLVEERSQVCFFRSADSKTTFHAKVFVLQGGTKRDIGFRVRGPMQLDSGGNFNKKAKIPVVHSSRIASEGVRGDEFKYQFEAEKGEYEICLSNDRHFEQAAKHVMLDISEVVEDKDEPSTKAGSEDANEDPLALITKGMQDLRNVFKKIEYSQERERIQLTQRTTAAEENHQSMEQSSLLETLVLLSVGALQIFFVRKWFSGKGTLLKQWA